MFVESSNYNICNAVYQLLAINKNSYLTYIAHYFYSASKHNSRPTTATATATSSISRPTTAKTSHFYMHTQQKLFQ